MELNTEGSRTSILLDNGEKYWMKTNDLAGTGIFEGAEISQESFSYWLRIRQYPGALNRAVAMLARRPCSAGEIKSRLARNRYADEVIELTVESVVFSLNLVGHSGTPQIAKSPHAHGLSLFKIGHSECGQFLLVNRQRIRSDVRISVLVNVAVDRLGLVSLR